MPRPGVPPGLASVRPPRPSRAAGSRDVGHGHHDARGSGYIGETSPYFQVVLRNQLPGTGDPGPAARPAHWHWPRGTVTACRAQAGVPGRPGPRGARDPSLPKM